MNNHTKAFIKFKINQLWDHLGVSEHSYCVHPSWFGRCHCGKKLSPETLAWLERRLRDPDHPVFTPDKDSLFPTEE